MTEGHNSDFFQDKKQPKSTQKNKSQHTFLLACVVIVYLVILAVIGRMLAISADNIIFSLSLYLYGLIGGFAVILMKNLMTQKDTQQRMLAEILEESHSCRMITDADLNTIYYNQKFQELVCTDTDHAKIEDFYMLFENSQKIKRQIQTLIKSLGQSGFEQTELTYVKDGQERILSIQAQSAKASIGHVNWCIDDITDMRQLNDAVTKEREKLVDFTDHAPVGFFSVDENGLFQFVNKTFATWLETDVETLLHKRKLHEFLPHTADSMAPYLCFDKDDEYQHGHVTFKSASGKETPATITHMVIKNDHGHIRTRSVIHDISSEIEVKTALKQSENRFERLFTEAPVGICLLSDTGILTECNQHFIDTVGHPAKMVTGRTMSDLISDEGKSPFTDWVGRIFKGQKAYSSIETTITTAHGPIIMQVYARKFDDQNHIMLHFIDLTELKSLEQQFTQSQKMQAIGQLAGGVAHDFNNLLTAMIGFCDLLLLRHKPGDSSFGDVMQIKQNANRAANLVRQLLAFSRQQTLQPKTLDMADVLTELSHLLRRLIGANIDLKIDHEAGLGLVKVDQGQMEQVLINLAVNARDAMKQNGQLSIKTANFTNKNDITLKGDDKLPSGEWVSISVTDSGTGIDPKNLSRIFEPFFSTKEIGAGTGLGLSTVHGIIHQTGGAISVDSVLGDGTTFTVYLPRHHEEEQAEEDIKEVKPEVAADLTGSAKILLVEDEDAVRTFSTRALGNKGYDVLAAESGIVALEMIQEQNLELELLITDVVMPEMDGPTLAGKIHDMFPSIKIIFISGYAEDKFKEDLGEDVFFLPKPFTLKQLATKVKEVLDS